MRGRLLISRSMHDKKLISLNESLRFGKASQKFCPTTRLWKNTSAPRAAIKTDGGEVVAVESGESAWKPTALHGRWHALCGKGGMKRGIAANIASFFMGVCRLSRSHDGWLINDLPPGLIQAAARQKNRRLSTVNLTEWQPNDSKNIQETAGASNDGWPSDGWLCPFIQGVSISWDYRGSLNYPPILGINQCKCMAIFRDFPWNCALFGVVSYNDLIMTPGCIFPPGSSCENPLSPRLQMFTPVFSNYRWATMCQKLTCWLFWLKNDLSPKNRIITNEKPLRCDMVNLTYLWCSASSFLLLRCSPHDAKVLKICHWVWRKEGRQRCEVPRCGNVKWGETRNWKERNGGSTII